MSDFPDTMLGDIARVFTENDKECSVTYDGWIDWEKARPPSKTGFNRTFSAQDILTEHQEALNSCGEIAPEFVKLVVVGYGMLETINEAKETLKLVYKTKAGELGVPPGMPQMLGDMAFLFFNPDDGKVPNVAIPLPERGVWAYIIGLTVFAAKIVD